MSPLTSPAHPSLPSPPASPLSGRGSPAALGEPRRSAVERWLGEASRGAWDDYYFSGERSAMGSSAAPSPSPSEDEGDELMKPDADEARALRSPSWTAALVKQVFFETKKKREPAPLPVVDVDEDAIVIPDAVLGALAADAAGASGTGDARAVAAADDEAEDDDEPRGRGGRGVSAAAARGSSRQRPPPRPRRLTLPPPPPCVLAPRSSPTASPEIRFDAATTPAPSRQEGEEEALLLLQRRASLRVPGFAASHFHGSPFRGAPRVLPELCLDPAPPCSGVGKGWRAQWEVLAGRGGGGDGGLRPEVAW